MQEMDCNQLGQIRCLTEEASISSDRSFDRTNRNIIDQLIRRWTDLRQGGRWKAKSDGDRHHIKRT